jgi:hypothetical protein
LVDGGIPGIPDWPPSQPRAVAPTSDDRSGFCAASIMVGECGAATGAAERPGCEVGACSGNGLLVEREDGCLLRGSSSGLS